MEAQIWVAAIAAVIAAVSTVVRTVLESWLQWRFAKSGIVETHRVVTEQLAAVEQFAKRLGVQVNDLELTSGLVDRLETKAKANEDA